MASILSAGTTNSTALNLTADTSGVLQLASNNGTTAVTINASQFVGIGTTSPATTGTKTIYIKAFGSQGGTVTPEDENIAGRLEPQYAGITTTLSSAINTATVDNFNIQNITNLDLNIGDYLLIDSEIMRIKTTVTGNPVYVFRGIYGTNASTHDNGSVVRRIKLRPIELRRHSIIRASGHTFEYVGFGPGNYSTAFPDRQSKGENR
jgi:hypothetical protein